MEKQCPICNKVFNTLNGRQKYCSVRCRKKSWKIKNKEKVLEYNRCYLRRRAAIKKSQSKKSLVCPRCGKPFLNTKSKNYSYIKFCSFNCQNIFNRSRRRKRDRESEPMRQCLACGKLFDPRGFHYYKTVQTCSKKCSKKLWRMNNSKTDDYKKKHAFNQRTRKHRIRANGGSFTYKQWESMKKKYGYKCAICGKKEPFLEQSYQYLTQDHIIPVTKGGPHIKENIQPLCMECNIRKHNN